MNRKEAAPTPLLRQEKSSICKELGAIGIKAGSCQRKRDAADRSVLSHQEGLSGDRPGLQARSYAVSSTGAPITTGKQQRR